LSPVDLPASLTTRTRLERFDSLSPVGHHSHRDAAMTQVLAVSGDGLYSIKVNGKPRKAVPGDHLAPLFKLDEKVMYTEGGASKKPKQAGSL